MTTISMFKKKTSLFWLDIASYDATTLSHMKGLIKFPYWVPDANRQVTRGPSKLPALFIFHRILEQRYFSVGPPPPPPKTVTQLSQVQAGGWGGDGGWRPALRRIILTTWDATSLKNVIRILSMFCLFIYLNNTCLAVITTRSELLI